MAGFNYKMATLRLALLSALAVPATLAAGPATFGWGDLTDEQQVKVERELAGRVAGEPIACITQSQIRDTIPIRDDLLLYEMRNGIVYANQPTGGCLESSRRTIVNISPTDRMCRGDAAEVRDVRVGVTVGQCFYSGFTPYTKIDSSD